MISTRLQRLWIQFKAWIRPKPFKIATVTDDVVPRNSYRTFTITFDANCFDRSDMLSEANCCQYRILSEPKKRSFLWFWKRRWKYDIQPLLPNTNRPIKKGEVFIGHNLITKQ